MARVRSPNYPYFSLPAAIEAVRKIYAKEHTHKADPLVMAKALGYGGMNGASMGQLSALKKYGLLEEHGKELKVSSDALMILVDPKDSVERAKAIVRAAFAPQLFVDLQAQYGTAVPSDENMRSFLLKRGFAPNTVDAPIRTYRETVEFAMPSKALYDRGVVDAGKANSEQPPPLPPSDPPEAGTSGEQRQPRKDADEVAMRQDIFSVDEGSVTIEWPASLSEDSLQDIKDWFIILERKIARSLAKSAIVKPENDDTTGNEDLT